MTQTNTTIVSENYWDKHGIPHVTLTDALWQIELSLKHNQTRGVFCLISEAGEGKSQGVAALARKYGRRLVDVRTAQLTHIGAGVPQRADETGHFEVAVPKDWPHEGEKCIMHFDEYNQGQNHAIALVFKMLEDRGIYGYKLPADCLVVISMNPSTAGYNVTKIEGNHAINRRVKKLYVYNTWADWKKHAESADFHHSDFPEGQSRPCHPSIVRFLTTTPNMLYTAKERDGNKQFACPATWQTASLDLYNLMAEGIPLTDERALVRVASSINTVNAQQLIDYIRNNENRIGPDEILKKYTQKSELRKRVLEMQREPGGNYPQLAETVAFYLFTDKPKPEACAPQLALFWHDMPDELANGFYTQLASAAKEGKDNAPSNNTNYMVKLTTELLKDPLYAAINKRLMSAHTNFEKDLVGSKGNPDPARA
jgi:hypothetical protein